MAIKKDTLDQLLSGRDPKEVFSKDGLFDELKKALAERVPPEARNKHKTITVKMARAFHRHGCACVMGWKAVKRDAEHREGRRR
jgi:putative transposase